MKPVATWPAVKTTVGFEVKERPLLADTAAGSFSDRNVPFFEPFFGQTICERRHQENNFPDNGRSSARGMPSNAGNKVTFASTFGKGNSLLGMTRSSTIVARAPCCKR